MTSQSRKQVGKNANLYLSPERKETCEKESTSGNLWPVVKQPTMSHTVFKHSIE